MAGLINNIWQTSSTLLSRTWGNIKNKFSEGVNYSYDNYYLKLSAASYFYFNSYHKEQYKDEKELNKISPKSRRYVHLTFIWGYILPIIPPTHSPVYFSILIPLFKIVLMFDAIFFKLQALTWLHTAFSLLGISWFAAFTIPIALLTAASYYRVLQLPRAPNDKSRLKWADTLGICLAFSLSLVWPIIFPIVSICFCLYFLGNRIFCVKQNYLRSANFKRVFLGPTNNKGNANREHDTYVHPEDITLGFEPDQDEVSKIRNMTTTRRERQIYTFGMIYFLLNLTMMLSQPLNIPIAISLAPILSGVYISLLVLVTLAAIIVPLYSYYNKDVFTLERVDRCLDHVEIRSRFDDKPYYTVLTESNTEENNKALEPRNN